MLPHEQLDPIARWLTRTKDAAQVLAWLGAAVFFGYRAYSGYFITDLDLKLECERKRQADTEPDLVSVCATVEKGERGAVALHDVRAWLCDHRDGHMAGNPRKLTAVRRFALHTGKDGLQEADPEHLDATMPLLN